MINIQNSVDNFKSEEEILAMFKEYDKDTWNNRGDNYDIIRTKKIFANGGEINLSSDVFLLDDVIILSAMSRHQPSIIIRHLRREHVSKIKFLDNSEKKGAALLITIHSQKIWKNVRTWVTPETIKYLDLHCSNIILTIPITNSDIISINKIKKRLFNFFKTINLLPSTPTVPLSVVSFFELEKCIIPFKLKAVSYNTTNSNTADGTQFIVIMRNNYSIKRSNIKLKRFLSTMKKSTVNLEGSYYNYFRIIKNDDIYEKFLNTKIFGTKNIETNEIYDVNGKAFGSLFDKEWLHCDIIDTYLNEWRKRMGEILYDPSKINENRIKIYNTLLYARLTRGIKITSLKAVSKSTFARIQENAKRIGCEKVYCHFSKIYNSIFDFDILIIPIHIDDHWLTGIIYQPKNCLIEIKKNDSNNSRAEIDNDDNIFSSIFIFDSLTTNFTPNKHACTAVLKEFVEACHNSLKEKFPENNWIFNKNKLKTIKLKNPFQQRNGYDCGLFMLEFIRQVMLNPKSLENLINGERMTNVFPGFSVTLGRNYLKTFVYSKVDLEKWIILREMEEYFLTEGGNKIKNNRNRRSRSVEPRKNINIEKKLKRRKSCSFLKGYCHRYNHNLTYEFNDVEYYVKSKRVKLF